MNFDQMMQHACSMELASKEVAYMKNSGIASQSREQQPNVLDINKLAKYAAQKGSRLMQEHSKYSCQYCVELTPHEELCRVRGATCNKCGKRNHFAKVCEIKIAIIITTQPRTQHTAATLKHHTINNDNLKRGYPSTDVR